VTASRVVAAATALILALFAAAPAAASAAPSAPDPASVAQPVAVSASPDAAAADGKRVTLDYQPDTTTPLLNPERGLTISTDPFQALSLDEINRAKHHGATLMHAYVDLGAYTSLPPVNAAPGSGTDPAPGADCGSSEYDDDDCDGVANELDPDSLPLTPELLSQLSASFALLRDNGLKVILRLSYSPKGSSVCSDTTMGGGSKPLVSTDAPLPRMLHHVEQLGPVLTENADVISSFEAGLLGEFGEWHCSSWNSTNGTPDNNDAILLDAKQKVLDKELATFPKTRQIALRYPADIALLYPEGPASAARIGNHQDCYASDDTDFATWVKAEPNEPMTSERRMMLMGVMGELGADSVISATVCATDATNDDPDVRLTCSAARAELPLMHMSYFTLDNDPDGLLNYSAGADPCWTEIVNRLGYRLQLDRVEVPASFTPGAPAHVSVTLTNTGWASMFNQRDVYLTLTQPGEQAHAIAPVKLDVDPRSWKAGQSVTIQAEVPVPDRLAPGRYELGLWLPDSEAAAKDLPKFAVQLAYVGTYRKETGVNVLSDQIVVGEPAMRGGRLADTGRPDAGGRIALGLAALGALTAGLLLRRRNRSAAR